MERSTTELERKVLGGMLLLDGDRPPPWAGQLYPEAFSSREHADIYSAIDDLLRAGDPVDIVSVDDKLRGWDIVLTEMLAQLAWDVPGTTCLNHWAKMLCDHARVKDARRRIDGLRARAAKSNADDLEAGLRDAIDALRSDMSDGQLTHVKSILPGAIKQIEQERDGTGSHILRTGIDRLDQRLRCRAGEITIVGGRPSMGKTALALCFARSAARDIEHGAVAIFSMEMQAVSLIRRAMASEAGLNSYRLHQCSSVAEWARLSDAANSLMQLDLWVDDRRGISAADIRQAMRKMRKVQLMVIDYIQIARLGYAERNDLQIGDFVRELREMSQEFDCHVLALSQLNRKVEDRVPPRPRASDLRGSGEIEQHADNILLLYRDHHYSPGTSDPHHAEIEITKQRNGPTGLVDLYWDAKTQTFGNPPHG